MRGIADLTPSEAIRCWNWRRKSTRPRRCRSDDLQLVGGIDVSVKENVSQAAIVVLTYPALEVIERVNASIPTPFPYIPGLLSFREGAVIIDALRQLKHAPDVFIVDGQGIAHPRHIGIASHIGLWIDVPTVGCGKTPDGHARAGPAGKGVVARCIMARSARRCEPDNVARCTSRSGTAPRSTRPASW